MLDPKFWPEIFVPAKIYYVIENYFIRSEILKRFIFNVCSSVHFNSDDSHRLDNSSSLSSSRTNASSRSLSRRARIRLSRSRTCSSYSRIRRSPSIAPPSIMADSWRNLPLSSAPAWQSGLCSHLELDRQAAVARQQRVGGRAANCRHQSGLDPRHTRPTVHARRGLPLRRRRCRRVEPRGRLPRPHVPACSCRDAGIPAFQVMGIWLTWSIGCSLVLVVG